MLKLPICYLPFALVGLALVGTLWSDASWSARLYAIGPTLKLLVLPGLFYHFERSSRGMWVFIAFLVSCALLMVMSWIVAYDPSLSLKAPSQGDARGIFVKNYIDQSQEFALCAVALVYPVIALAAGEQDSGRRLLLGLLFARLYRQHGVRHRVTDGDGDDADHAGGIRADSSEAANQPDDLRRDGRHGRPALGYHDSTCAGVPRDLLKDYRLYKTRQGVDIDRASARVLAKIAALLFRSAGDRPRDGLAARAVRAGRHRRYLISATSEVIGNPHNQTLNVAVQWGTVGVILLYAMWLVHLLLFRGEGLVAWIGLLVVVQNIFTSLFNSHIFDFHEGWMYVLGVGVAGGMTLAARQRKLRADPAVSR